MPRPLRLCRALSVGMGVKSKLSTMLNTTPAPSANTLPYVTLPYVLLTFHTQSVLDLKYRSAPSFSTQRSSLPCHSRTQRSSLPCHSRTTHPERSSLPCHSQRSAAVYPVILNAAQRSEESKSLAPAAISHFRFLPSLEMTGANFCYSERMSVTPNSPLLSFIPSSPLSCHPERPSHSAIPNGPPILSFRPLPCHSEWPTYPCHSEHPFPVIPEHPLILSFRTQ